MKTLLIAVLLVLGAVVAAPTAMADGCCPDFTSSGSTSSDSGTGPDPGSSCRPGCFDST